MSNFNKPYKKSTNMNLHDVIPHMDLEARRRIGEHLEIKDRLHFMQSSKTIYTAFDFQLKDRHVLRLYDLIWTMFSEITRRCKFALLKLKGIRDTQLEFHKRRVGFKINTASNPKPKKIDNFTVPVYELRLVCPKDDGSGYYTISVEGRTVPNLREKFEKACNTKTYRNNPKSNIGVGFISTNAKIISQYQVIKPPDYIATLLGVGIDKDFTKIHPYYFHSDISNPRYDLVHYSEIIHDQTNPIPNHNLQVAQGLKTLRGKVLSHNTLNEASTYIDFDDGVFKYVDHRPLTLSKDPARPRQRPNVEM